jgi:hypothetical protein
MHLQQQDGRRPCIYLVPICRSIQDTQQTKILEKNFSRKVKPEGSLMILDLTRSHGTSHEIPGFWALLLATSETDEHLFFPLGIYYILSSCLEMKIF